jgi:hypothetical protein
MLRLRQKSNGMCENQGTNNLLSVSCTEHALLCRTESNSELRHGRDGQRVSAWNPCE